MVHRVASQLKNIQPKLTPKVWPTFKTSSAILLLQEVTKYPQRCWDGIFLFLNLNMVNKLTSMSSLPRNSSWWSWNNSMNVTRGQWNISLSLSKGKGICPAGKIWIAELHLRGEHFPEFAKNHWGKVPNFWDLGKSSMKFNSAHVVAIWDGEVLTTWRGNFSECKE